MVHYFDMYWTENKDLKSDLDLMQTAYLKQVGIEATNNWGGFVMICAP